jgi:hypothetical protein
MNAFIQHAQPQATMRVGALCAYFEAKLASQPSNPDIVQLASNPHQTRHCHLTKSSRNTRKVTSEVLYSVLKYSVYYYKKLLHIQPHIQHYANSGIFDPLLLKTKKRH